MEFIKFPKMARIARDIIITEKIDGTNAQVCISDDGLEIKAGSRNRWVVVGDDNYGFAGWVEDNKEELLKLGPGRHYGEWWGAKIQRKYGMDKRVFSLFNTGRWTDENCPKCCRVVPILYHGPFTTEAVDASLEKLIDEGSVVAPGYMNPEGIVIFHIAANKCMKKTCKNDGIPKSLQKGE